MSAVELLEIPVKGVGGEERERLHLEASRLDQRVRYRLLKEAVVMYAANRRVGTHSTKTRGEIAGSTRKPYRQKGTGRARAGSRKSPIWRGGGTVFGPLPRDYSYAIHRKQRRLALRSAILSKFQEGNVVVVEGLQLSEPKTKRLQGILRALGVERSCLIGLQGPDRNLVLSARNIPGVLVAPVDEWNALDVLRVSSLLLTREAYDGLVGRLGDAEADLGESEPADSTDETGAAAGGQEHSETVTGGSAGGEEAGAEEDRGEAPASPQGEPSSAERDRSPPAEEETTPSDPAAAD